MKSIEELLEEIRTFEDFEAGCAQVLDGLWEYEITVEGEVLFLKYIGPEAR